MQTTEGPTSDLNATPHSLMLEHHTRASDNNTCCPKIDHLLNHRAYFKAIGHSVSEIPPQMYPGCANAIYHENAKFHIAMLFQYSRCTIRFTLVHCERLYVFST